MLLLMLLAPTLLMRLIECSPQRDSERPSKAGLYSRVKIRVPSVLKERVPPPPPAPDLLIAGNPGNPSSCIEFLELRRLSEAQRGSPERRSLSPG